MAYKGECNGCGRCCTNLALGRDSKLKEFRCTNLVVHSKVGRTLGTDCMIWAMRTEGMPIVMLSEDGDAYMSQCLPKYPRSQDAIPPECSYEFEPDSLIQIRPAWSLTYAPSL